MRRSSDRKVKFAAAVWLPHEQKMGLAQAELVHANPYVELTLTQLGTSAVSPPLRLKARK